MSIAALRVASYSDLSGTIPQSLTSLTRLRTLDLETTFILDKGLTGTLPQNLGAWSHMEYLCVVDDVHSFCCLMCCDSTVNLLPCFHCMCAPSCAQGNAWQLVVGLCAKLPGLPDQCHLHSTDGCGVERHTAVVDRLTDPHVHSVSCERCCMAGCDASLVFGRNCRLTWFAHVVGACAAHGLQINLQARCPLPLPRGAASICTFAVSSKCWWFFSS